MAQPIKPKTTTKMMPVTTRTNSDRSKRSFACPDAGAKILAALPPPGMGTLEPVAENIQAMKPTAGKAFATMRARTVVFVDRFDRLASCMLVLLTIRTVRLLVLQSPGHAPTPQIPV